MATLIHYTSTVALSGLVNLSAFLEQVFRPCKFTTETIAKDCSSHTVYVAWLQYNTRKPQWFQYIKLIFLKIPNVTTWSVFQNQVTFKEELFVI